MHAGTTGSGRPPRVAIVGGGMIAEIHRRSALLAGAHLVGTLGADPTESSALAERWGAERALSGPEEIATCDADVVHICTPNATHAPYARIALEAGKHVVCEKPLGVDAAEADELSALAREAGVVAAVPFVYRYHPLVREIRARRIAGEFGTWHLLHGSYAQDWMLSPTTSSWRVDPAAGGASRAFADIGSHWCDLVEWVSGERFTRLTADLTIAIPARPASSGASFSGAGAGPLVPVRTEDVASVLLRTARDVPATLTVSQVSAGRKNRLWFELDGAEASAVFDQENPETVWLGAADGARVIFRDPTTGSPEARRLATLPAGHPQGWAHCFENFVADVYRAVAGHEVEGLPTFADGARSAHLVEAVLASNDDHAWREIATP